MDRLLQKVVNFPRFMFVGYASDCNVEKSVSLMIDFNVKISRVQEVAVLHRLGPQNGIIVVKPPSFGLGNRIGIGGLVK